MNALKNIKSILLALMLLGLSYGGQAEANKSGYRNCLKTKPIQFAGTIVDAVIATPALSTLKELVIQAKLVDALNGPGPLTVYAPVNAAFEAIPKDILDGIANDNGVLTSVLTYHVSAGIKDPRRLRIPAQVKTLQGQTVFFSFGKEPQINQSIAECRGVRTTNGIVWLIDSVLLPQFKISPGM
jgi:uncharacterized surface protein with fasciclin (FAS1) repeats